nr:phage/plasmid primase, P4 family [uncultured Cohaesibacter sp.]
MNTQRKTMLDRALAYARRGYAVFPCHPGLPDEDALPKSKRKAKRPLNTSDVKGKGGFHEATTDEAQIRVWWEKWPDALIGSPPASKGMLVIDVDPEPDETCEWVVSELEKDLGEPLPDAPIVITQSGGWHIWLRRAEGVELGNRKLCKRDLVDEHGEVKKVGRVDARCDNGYVILPPSRLTNGNTYTWRDGADFEPPVMPQSLVDAIAKKEAVKPVMPAPSHNLAWSEDAGDKAIRRYARGALDNACAEMARTGKGGRGSALNAHAYSLGKLVGAGALDEGEVRHGLEMASDACGLTGTDGARERDAKIARGLEAGKGACGDVQLRLKEIAEEARQKAARYQGHTRKDSGGPDAPPPATPEDYGGGSPSPQSNGSAQTDGGQAASPSESRTSNGDKENADPETVARCAAFDLNDTGNAQRLLAHFGLDIMSVREHGFFQWSGTHWEMTGGDERVAIFAQKTAKRIELEIGHIQMTPRERELIEAAVGLEKNDDMEKDEKARIDGLRADAAMAKKALESRKNNRRRFALSSGNNNKLVGMIKQAAPHITVGPEALDADHMAFNVENGTLIFRIVDDPDDPSDSGPPRKKLDVELVPHDRSMRISKCAPVVYDPKAKCPKWEAFFDHFQTVDRARFLQAYFGYGLTGLTGEQKLIYMYGAGANGKSTAVEALCRLLGAYAGQLNPESVSGNGQRRGDQATPDLAPLVGKRLVRVSELAKGQAVKEDLIKGLTGGEPIQARLLHKGFFDLVPIFKAVMSGNDMPYITGTDWGIWRRLLIVPWEVTITDEERRPMDKVLAEFDAERSGILNWLIKGLAIYAAEGLKVPESVTSLTNSYKSEMDPIQNFINACVVHVPPPEKEGEPVSEVTGAAMYKAYETWCRASGVKIFSSTLFGRELPKKGVEKVNGRIRKYINVQVRLPDEIGYEDEFPTQNSSRTHHD